MVRIGFGVLFLLGALEPAYAQVPTVDFSVKDSLKLSAKLYKPEGVGPFPAVILLHDCDGPSGNAPIDKVAILLRASGYIGIAVDSFGGRGVSGSACEGGNLKAPTSTDLVEDAFAANRYLASLAFVDKTRIGLLGWGDGGRAALLTLKRNANETNPPPFSAFAAYYPDCRVFGETRTANASVLILTGDRNEFSIPFDCQEFRKHHSALGFDVSVVVYPGATYGFDFERNAQRKSHSLQADPAAASDSRDKLLAFFNRTLMK